MLGGHDHDHVAAVKMKVLPKNIRKKTGKGNRNSTKKVRKYGSEAQSIPPANLDVAGI